MKKLILSMVGIAVISILLVSTVFAGVGNTIPVNGKHYNLNIIGAKNVGDVGDSNGHTLFVKLNGKTKIVMTQDPDGQFKVTDRNGLDGQASFNLAPGHYNIYATALGKPNGKVHIDAMGEFEDAVEGSTLILLGYVDISRNKGSPQSLNINELFYVDVTLCTAVDAEGNCIEWVTYEDYWVFDIEELLEYYWDYNNDGLKLLQVRLYECELDPTGQAEDYCRWSDGTPINSKKTIISA
ncbi:MAG: hypothetical protein AABW46_01410 [Nanoarchaeota archaeon]